MGAYHQPPEPYSINEQMTVLINNFTKSKKHIIEKIALFHLQFEGIHPFIDGNGRTGRLILNFMFMQSDYPAINIKFSDRKKYYKSFDEYYMNDDPTEMIKIITQELDEQLSSYLKWRTILKTNMKIGVP